MRKLNGSFVAFLATLCLWCHLQTTKAECKFVLMNNIMIHGGVGITAQTRDECESTCLMNSSCQGFDWSLTNSRGHQCFLLSTQNGKQKTSNVEHFERVCGVECWFILVNNTIIYGGMAYPAPNLDECKLTCLRNHSCLSFDWSLKNRQGHQCFLLSTQDGKHTASDVEHYDQVCSGSPTTPSGSTKCPKDSLICHQDNGRSYNDELEGALDLRANGEGQDRQEARSDESRGGEGGIRGGSGRESDGVGGGREGETNRRHIDRDNLSLLRRILDEAERRLESPPVPVE